MKCVACDSYTFQLIFEKNSCQIEKCLVCGLVQVTNRPSKEEVVAIYDKDFFETYYRELENNRKKQRYEYLNFNNKLDQIEKRTAKKGNILDIGCSFGFFLDAARQRGWTVAGIDLAEYAAKFAAQRFGIRVINKTITEAEFEENSFDVITMWNTIEHLINPKQELEHLSNFLKDDGLLVVSTANVDSLRARIEGRRWRIWIPPEHLSFFSPQTMRNLFDKCGLVIFDQETAVPYEGCLRKLKIYNLLDKLKVSDNVVYYARKLEMN